MPAQYELIFDKKGSGFKVNETAGETLGNHKLVYRGADGYWYLADADAATTMPVLGITMGPINGGIKGEILELGYIGDNSWTWTAGAEVYASTVAGELTQTAPTKAGDIVQVIAIAAEPTIIQFFGKVGGAIGASNTLEGHTAYVGFDASKTSYVNYFLCDGVTDNTQVQQAVDYIETLTGGSLFFERGTYSFDATVNMPTDVDVSNPISLFGTGWESEITRTTTAPLFTCAGATNRCRNLVFRDLKFDEGGQTGELINFNEADRLRIEDCFFEMGTVGSYAIDATETWDIYLYGNLFRGGGASGQPIVYIYNGDSNNSNNWRFLSCRFERATVYNSIAIHSDGTGGGGNNHNIHVLNCKIHGALSASFTNGAILFESTDWSSIRNNWIVHHLGNVVEIDDDCNLIEVCENHFKTYVGQGNPTSFISIDGNNCNAHDNYIEGTPTQMILIGANATDCSVSNIISAETSTYLTDNGTNTDIPEKFFRVLDPDTNIGHHPAVIMVDNLTTDVYNQMEIPNDFNQIVTASAVVIAAATGNIYRGCVSNYGKTCSQDYDAHTGALAAGAIAMTLDVLTCLDLNLSTLLSSIDKGDLVGVKFTRYGANASDTINEDCYYLGIKLRYI